MLRCKSRRFWLRESLYHTSKTPNDPATSKKVTYFVAVYPPIAVFWQELPEIGYFLLYGIFVLILGIAVVISVVIFGFATLCIGFLLLIIPFISAVVLLPVSYTFRAFSIEFLGQFGGDYNLNPQVVEETQII